ncbi:putative PH-domain protein [Cryptosporidium bovis]|uniref:putative PH-domain protein n=1 Tax=Cryptosporidium bovis TaxID=310047 RepID=UPI00351A63AE|nr:putative PH-domain protein [Cryptosporidium bovis]
MIDNINRNYDIDCNIESDVYVLKNKDNLTVAEDLEIIETSYSNYSDDNKLIVISRNIKDDKEENEGAIYSDEVGDNKIKYLEKNVNIDSTNKVVGKSKFIVGRNNVIKDEQKNNDFLQIKNWELNRVENYMNFVYILNPVFEELTYSVTEVMKLSKELSLILQQRTKLWNQYTRGIDMNINTSVKNIFSIPMRPTHISKFGMNNSLEIRNTGTYTNSDNSHSAVDVSTTLGGSFNISNNTLSTDVEHNSNRSFPSTLINISNGSNNVISHNGNNTNDNNKAIMSSNNNIVNVNRENICKYIFKSSSMQKNWPNLLNDYFRQESYSLKKLTQSIETDVVNGHLSWISKRYFKNAQSYIKDLKNARKEFYNASMNAKQSWNKYDQAFKNSQRLDIDVNYSVKNKYYDSWYCDQLYRHNVAKFIDAQKKYLNTFILTIENLIELENWRSSSIQLTINYYLLKQNEFYELLRKTGDNICRFIDGNDTKDENQNNSNDNSNFDITTTVPGLRPPPIPINEFNSKYSKNYMTLNNSYLIKSTSSLLNYPDIPKSSLVIHHGHVELFRKRFIFGQWQSAYLILTKDKFLYLLDSRDDIEMEELLKYDEKPIFSVCISPNYVKINESGKRGKRCFCLGFKQKLFTKKVIIRCSSENECSNLTDNIKSILNNIRDKSGIIYNALI